MNSVIVLNGKGEFWDEVTTKKATKYLIKNKVTVMLEHQNIWIQGYDIRYKLPVVVMFPEFFGYKIKPRKGPIPYSAQTVFHRDNNECQYWHFNKNGKRFAYKCNTEDITIDHVKPKILGGETSYENCVCCCRWHNEQVKKNHTLEECGLILRREPKTPIIHPGDRATVRFTYNPKKLSHRLYMEKVLNKSFSRIAG